jgi:D-3-phosphoglycerate dehydrogenase / 2-oxoglutarate reductase
MYRVLITAPYFIPVVEDYRDIFHRHGAEIVVHPVEERMSEPDLLAAIGDIDGVICGDDPFTERVLIQAPRLKVISKWGTGIDSIDQQACKKYGVRVCNTPNAFSHPVADSVLAYALCFARKTPWMDDDIKSGTWFKTPGFALNECTFGIIGLGNCGKQVARRLHAFGARILGNDIKPIDIRICQETGVVPTNLTELLAESDIVSLNCDLNPTSDHIINEKSLALMKSSAFLINTARGGLVDSQALSNALSDGTIAGAGLDVFEIEPLPADSPLLNMPQVLLAPHNANSSPKAWTRVHSSTIDNLFSVLTTQSRANEQASFEQAEALG